MLTSSESYQQRIREEHERDGLYRSGEGTEQEILKRMREREEQILLQEMLESH